MIIKEKKMKTISENDENRLHHGIAKKEDILMYLKVKTTPPAKRVNKNVIIQEIIFIKLRK